MEDLRNDKKMTLIDYYRSLERETPPKTAFVNEVAEACGVEINTVRNWILYERRPISPAYIAVLVEKTGIPAENLWDDDQHRVL